MGQTIVQFCDPDYDSGMHEGATYRMHLQKRVDGKWVDIVPESSSDMEMCDDIYAAKVNATAEMWLEYGRKPDESPAGSDRFKCPAPGCGKDYSTRGTLTKHMRDNHGAILPTNGHAPTLDAKPAEAEPVLFSDTHAEPGHYDAKLGEYVCPECKAAGEVWTSAKPQGLGAHRSKKHGVAGAARKDQAA